MSKKEVEAQVLADIEAFFFNMPEAEVKKKLWGLFASWVHYASEAADGKEISQMLFFYERLTDLMDALARLSK